MQSHYEINVALNGRHFFATHQRSCITRNDYKDVVREIRKRFPESDGFKVTASHWIGIGYPEGHVDF